MSGGDGGAPGKAPKQLSSRLMTMKFMQRAAATPTGAAAAASTLASGPNPKRLKNNSSQPSTPPNGPSTGTRTPAYPAAADAAAPSKRGKSGDIDWRRAAREAAHAEEERRQTALERAGAQGDETRWVLHADEERSGTEEKTQNGLRILRYGEVDADEGYNADATDEDQPWRAEGVATGRMRFGGFKSKGETKPPANDVSDDNGSGADSDSDASQSLKVSDKEPGEGNSTRRQSQAEQMHGRSGGISSGGGGGSAHRSRSTNADAKCFRCGQPGHMKVHCPLNDSAFRGGTKRARR